MQTTTALTPSIALTKFAKEHLNELDFGKAPVDASPKENLNWFGGCVHKIHNANSPISTIATVIGSIFLAVSLIGIPVLVAYYREIQAQTAILCRMNEKISQINERALIIEKLDLK